MATGEATTVGGVAMNGFEVELPDEEPGGESAWVAEAVREKLAACSEMEYLEVRAARGRQEAFARVLAKVPDVEPMTGDER